MVDDELSEAIVAAVRETARAEILPRFRRLDPAEIETKTGPNDLVTIADREAEARLTETFAALMPDALIVGEEAVAANPDLVTDLPATGRVVFIDPVDGTSNFAADLSTFGVIVAVVEDGRTVLGLLYDPVLDDWIIARRGEGAWFQRPGETPRRLSGPQATPAHGYRAYVSLMQVTARIRAGIHTALGDRGTVTSLRCSCHEYRSIALGHADFSVARKVQPWDHAAGALVLEECGGAVLTDSGAPYSPVQVPRAIIAMGKREMAADLDRFLRRYLELVG